MQATFPTWWDESYGSCASVPQPGNANEMATIIGERLTAASRDSSCPAPSPRATVNGGQRAARRVRPRVIVRMAACTLLLSSLAGVLFWWMTASRLSEIRERCDLAVAQQHAAIALKEHTALQAEFARSDAVARAATVRWTEVVREVSLPTATRQPMPSGKPSDGQAADSHRATNPSHWAYRPLQPVALPDVTHSDWPRNAIDYFVLARLEAAGIEPQPAASPRMLVRRAAFAITGIPPHPEDVELVTEERPQTRTRSENQGRTARPPISPPSNDRSYELYVERLLADPSFGEHLATGWLDLVRYADSNGYEEDELRAFAHTYRDFVIWALNQDLAYDEFVRWQIAGDELAPANPLAVAATGFLATGPINTFMPQESERWDELDGIVSTLGSAMLGVTVGCARCHDHPYDGISTDEYYGLVAIFHPTRREHRYLLPDGGAAFRRLADPVDQRWAEVREILLRQAREDNIARLDFPEEDKALLRQPIDPRNEHQIRLLSLCGRCLMVDDSFIDEDSEPLPEDASRYEQLLAELAELEPGLPPRPPRGLVVTGSEIAEIPVLDGGSLNRRRGRVGPRFLSVVASHAPSSGNPDWQQWDPASHPPRPRTACARWLTDVDHGAGSLLARVIVNRIWQHYFGRGLVATANDFGTEGATPSHPELLEWLAGELVRSNWSQKHIHRLIVLSATYRTGQGSAEIAASDPDGNLFARHRPQRLTPEMFRDALLMLGQNLNRQLYGPAFQPAIPREAIFNRDAENIDDTWPTKVLERPEIWRRSVYILKRRTNPVPFLQIFDAPGAAVSCSQRTCTAVPTQALALLNDPWLRSQCSLITSQLADAALVCSSDRPAPSGDASSSHVPSGSAPHAAQVQELFRLVFHRPASADEVVLAERFLEHGTLADLCQTLLMTNEYLYVE